MTLEDDLRELSRIPLLEKLEAEPRRLLAFSGETKILRAGDVLFRKGEATDDDGTPATRIVGKGVLIGEIALLSQTERPVTAIAREPSTVLKISRALFHRVLKEYPRSAMNVRAAIETRLIEFTADLANTRRLFTDSSSES
jgi:signal-transduction protein with cAMP-binding, CBS, and nucleotidyltransferase domain